MNTMYSVLSKLSVLIRACQIGMCNLIDVINY